MTTDVPAEVECYHSLFPLEPESATTPDKVCLLVCVMCVFVVLVTMFMCVLIFILQINQSLFGYVSTCYKAVNAKSKSFCVLRRLHGECVIEPWHIVGTVEPQLSKPFGTRAGLKSPASLKLCMIAFDP